MHPTLSRHRHAWLSLACLVAVSLAPLGARAGNSTDIVRESARTLEGGGGRVASFWWLPQEYWELIAKELALPAEEQAKVRTVFRDYLLVAALESRLNTDRKAEFPTIAELVKRSRFYRNDAEVQVLRDVNPELARLVPSLVYLLRASLAGLGDGLRVLPLANVDAKGNPILSGDAPGELRLEFRFEEAGPTQTVYWRAPLTAIAGAKKCPKGGEALEASYAFCPWHGVKLGPER